MTLPLKATQLFPINNILFYDGLDPRLNGTALPIDRCFCGPLNPPLAAIRPPKFSRQTLVNARKRSSNTRTSVRVLTRPGATPQPSRSPAPSQFTNGPFIPPTAVPTTARTLSCLCPANSQ